MSWVDDSVKEFLEDHAYGIEESKGRLTITGHPEVKIGMSILFILIGIPVIIFFALRVIHVFKDGVDVRLILWLLLASALVACWLYFAKRIFAPRPTIWLVLDKNGIVTPQDGFLPISYIHAIGVKSKKLSGVLSAAYLDNHFRKAIYIESRGREVELLVFETRREAIEMDIKALVTSIADTLGIKDMVPESE